MFDIRVGTLLRANSALSLIPKLLPHGFECFAITFGESVRDTNLPDMAARVKDALGDSDVTITAIGVYGNPLYLKEEFTDTLRSMELAIDNAHLFGCDIVSCFAGRLPNVPIDQSIDAFRTVFSELSRRAADKGVRLAFENCPMGGDWNRGRHNLAINPDAWEMMFDALPAENLGLEWEPAHQLMELTDPVAQLRKWVGKVFHVHGKDATIAWDVLRAHGWTGNVPFRWHRTPGFGDTNWNDILTILRQHGYQGTIDIEGYHDPVYNTPELEWPSQLRALRYLKECRGGLDFLDI